MTAFVRPGNLADALRNFNANSHGAMPNLPIGVMRSLAKVKLLHLGYSKKVTHIGTTSARNTKFNCEEFGGEITVESYFFKSKFLFPISSLSRPDENLTYRI